MTTDPASKTRERIFLGGCVLAVVFSIGGVFYVGFGQAHVLEAVQSKPVQSGTLSYTYTDKDDVPHVVTVNGDANKPDDLVRALRDAVDRMQETYPRRK